MQLEDKIADEQVLDDDLQESLQQLRTLVNPWTLIEQQVSSQRACAPEQILKSVTVED